jgi:hypothetical protein
MIATIEAAESGAPVEVGSAVEIAPPLPEGWDARAATLVGRVSRST